VLQQQQQKDMAEYPKPSMGGFQNYNQQQQAVNLLSS
jgi:hypothetical protein